MDIKTLRHFTTVAQLQNVSRAADLLHVSQSSLSKQIAGLESELGVNLFDRSGKTIRLNSAGMQFYESCSRILSEYSTAEEALRLVSRSKDRRIRIGTAGTPDTLLKAISAFTIAHPETEFIINGHIEEQINLNINDYDMMIIPDEPRFENLSGYTLYQESYYFAVPADSQDVSAITFDPEMLLHQPVVFLRNSELSPEFPYRVCSAMGWELGVVNYVDTRDMHRRMIASGNAAGFVPKSAMESYRKDRGTRFLPVMSSRFTRTMKICFLREKHLSDLGIEFRRFIIDHFDLENNAG